jgi:uncharacterized protein DUF6703
MSSSNRRARQRPLPRDRQRPLPPGGALYTPGATGARRSVERRSAALLLFLHQLPTWLLPVLLVALLVTGLAVHGLIGAAALCGVAAVLALLAFVSWPQLAARGRLGRVVAIGCVLALAVLQATR